MPLGGGGGGESQRPSNPSPPGVSDPAPGGLSVSGQRRSGANTRTTTFGGDLCQAKEKRGRSDLEHVAPEATRSRVHLPGRHARRVLPPPRALLPHRGRCGWSSGASRLVVLAPPWRGWLKNTLPQGHSGTTSGGSALPGPAWLEVVSEALALKRTPAGSCLRDRRPCSDCDPRKRMGAAMRLGHYRGDGERSALHSRRRPAAESAGRPSRADDPAQRIVVSVTRGGCVATSRACPRGTLALLASASGLPIRPVLKHGPRSLTCRAGAAAWLSRARESRAQVGHFFGKQNWRCGMNRKRVHGAQAGANLEPTKGVGRLRQRGGGHGSRNPLRTCPPWKRLSGGRVQRLEEHRRVAWCRCAPALENPEDRVPTPGRTHNASGLQGKGSRQNGSVTGEKDWLEGLGAGSQSNPSAVGGTARAAPAARRVVAMPGGGRTGSGPFGGAFRRRTADSELNADKGNPTV
ncbi:hypothetical protein H6P81_021214 [Aristolochia fimbriata]|uniref:Uncharacterized protein n=1 Tax=Aristolochia fimbriata TaxID=158543 RepID=A0AAV7DRE1_ARIFI|nr:hypothetical protein H6P81_021214 [Aristolochia fimbriata]